MWKLPGKYSHFLFGVIQSGLTCAVAAAITIAPRWQEVPVFAFWLRSWLMAWVVMVPVVLLAAPLIRRLTIRLTNQAVVPASGKRDPSATA
jgi:hypothetical protein